MKLTQKMPDNFVSRQKCRNISAKMQIQFKIFRIPNCPDKEVMYNSDLTNVTIVIQSAGDYQIAHWH